MGDRPAPGCSINDGAGHDDDERAFEHTKNELLRSW